MKKFFYLAAIAAIALVVGGCSNDIPEEPNLYVQYELNREESQLYYITYETIFDNYSEENTHNIRYSRKGEYVYKGKKYHMFCIPRGNLEIYMEWTDVSHTSSKMGNERVKVNTRKYEWVRLDWIGDDTYNVVGGNGVME